MTSRSCSRPSPQRPLELARRVADDPHLDRLDPEREQRLREVRPVAVGAVAAHELGARDEDRARAAGLSPPASPVGVTVITRGRQPASAHALAADRDHEVLGRADVEPVALALERQRLALLDRALEDHCARRARRARIATYDEPPSALDVEVGAGTFATCAVAARLLGALRRVLALPDDFQALITTTVTTRDRGEHDEHDVRLEAPAPALRTHRRAARAVLAVVGDEARVELVDVELTVEAEVVGVRAEEALDVRLGREQLEPLLLERAEVLAADLRRLLGLGELDPAAHARLAEAVADLEQGREA